MYYLDKDGFYDELLDMNGRRLSCISGYCSSMSVRWVNIDGRSVYGHELRMFNTKGHAFTVFLAPEKDVIRDAMGFLWNFISTKPHSSLFSFIYRAGPDKRCTFIIMYDGNVVFPVYRHLNFNKEDSHGKK